MKCLVKILGTFSKECVTTKRFVKIEIFIDSDTILHLITTLLL